MPKDDPSDSTDASGPTAEYAIRLAKQAFTFSSAHFITYAGDTCEPLHGHNYRATFEVAGPLDENHYVLDFIAVRDAAAAVVAQIDHAVLLPTEHPRVRVEETLGPGDAEEVTATFGGRRWVFPRDECRLLPLANTTAELLARWLGERLAERLREAGHPLPGALTVTVDECDGQAGVCRLTGL